MCCSITATSTNRIARLTMQWGYTRLTMRSIQLKTSHTCYCELLKLIVLLEYAKVRHVVVLRVFYRSRGTLDWLRRRCSRCRHVVGVKGARGKQMEENETREL